MTVAVQEAPSQEEGSEGLGEKLASAQLGAKATAYLKTGFLVMKHSGGYFDGALRCM